MNILQLDDFKRLCRVRNDNAATIYLPTHKSGVEVNEGIDRIAFKNEVHKIMDLLEAKGFEEGFVKKYMRPFFDLLQKDDFWKSTTEGLAVFATECDFYSYKLPFSVEAHSSLANSFMLMQLLPVLDDAHYFILALEQNHSALYRCTKYSIKEVDTKARLPKMKEIMGQYELAGQNEGREYDTEDHYLYEFSRTINAVIKELLHDEKAPLVLAGAEYFHHIYSDVNTYHHLLHKGLNNPANKSKRELHAESLQLLKDELGKPLTDGIQRYKALAGSGQTSYDLETLVFAALDGKIEQAFVQEKHIWGKINQQDRTIELHDEQEAGDQCLVNLIACTTIEDSGKAFLITHDQQPEKELNPPVLAIFRY